MLTLFSLFSVIPTPRSRPPLAVMPVPVPVPAVPSLLPPEMRNHNGQLQRHVFASNADRPRRPDYPSSPTKALPAVRFEDSTDLVPASDSDDDTVQVKQELALAPALPPAAAVNLLNNLLVFYQHERNWVHRTRASIELALVQGPLVVVPKIGSPGSQRPGSSSASAPLLALRQTDTDTDSAMPTDESEPATLSSDDERDIVKKEEDADGTIDLSVPTRRLSGSTAGPLTLRATQCARAPASRWLKRKQSFKLHLGPLSARSTTRSRIRATGQLEPGTQLLTLFGELVDARMESCLRITQLIRNSNRSMLHA